MKADFYLVIKGKKRGTWVEMSGVRVTRRKPGSVAGDEVAMAMSINIPDSLFIKPVLQASISIPDMPSGLEITTEVTDNIAAIIKEQTGITLNISPLDDQG